MIYTPIPRAEISTMLPPQARPALVEAGLSRDMFAINAAHRYARAMHPQFFNMDDDSHSVKQPKAQDNFK